MQQGARSEELGVRSQERVSAYGSDKSHKHLLVWQQAMQMVEAIYDMTRNFPSQEQFGLTSQMRRSAVSIASNIAEGAARKSNKEKIHFFVTARGSLSELDTQIEISRRLRLATAITAQRASDDLDHVSRLLNGLIASRVSRV